MHLAHLIQKLDFDMIQLGGKVYIYLMRVHKTSCFIPEGIQFLLTVLSDFHYAGRSVYTFSIQEYGNHKIANGISTGFQQSLFPGLQGIKEEQRFFFAEHFISKSDEVGLNFTGFLFIDPVNNLIARVSNFSEFSESLILGTKFPSLSIMAASLYTPPKEGQFLEVII